jgi:MOSC domain-containing protein YiiM
MKIKAISISDRKGVRKKNVSSAMLRENFGLENDAHGGKWHRQVSFLAQESINTMREKGLDVVAGNFAENITTEGIDLTKLGVGTHISLGETEVIISQLGKVCHHKCAIFYQAGDCVMPREGIFAIVKSGGTIRVGDSITILPQISSSAAVIGSADVEKNYGLRLQTLLGEKWSPAFVRFDRLNADEDNLQEILQDLLDYQKIDRVIILDPDGRHQLALLNYRRQDGDISTYGKGGSELYYCRSLEDLRGI